MSADGERGVDGRGKSRHLWNPMSQRRVYTLESTRENNSSDGAGKATSFIETKSTETLDSIRENKVFMKNV